MWGRCPTPRRTGARQDPTSTVPQSTSLLATAEVTQRSGHVARPRAYGDAIEIADASVTAFLRAYRS